MSEAAQQLARAGSARRLAPRLDVDRSTIGRWVRGEARPTQAQRERIRAELGIAIDAWDMAPTTAAAAPEADTDAAAPIPPEDRTVPRLRALLARIDAQRSAAGLSPKARVDLDRLELAAVRELGRLDGSALTEAQIVAHPAWQRVEDAIMAAVADMPLAVAALLDATNALARAQGATDEPPTTALADWRRDFAAEVAAIEAAERQLLAALKRAP